MASERKVTIWDPTTGQSDSFPLATRESFAVNTRAFSVDGEQLATVSGPTTIQVWNATTGQELAAFGADSNTRMP